MQHRPWGCALRWFCHRCSRLDWATAGISTTTSSIDELVLDYCTNMTYAMVALLRHPFFCHRACCRDLICMTSMRGVVALGPLPSRSVVPPVLVAVRCRSPTVPAATTAEQSREQSRAVTQRAKAGRLPSRGTLTANAHLPAAAHRRPSTAHAALRSVPDGDETGVERVASWKQSHDRSQGGRGKRCVRCGRREMFGGRG